MNTSIINQVHDAIQEETPKASTLIAVCESNDDITVSLFGYYEKIGKALYAAMYDDNQPVLAGQIYEMVKMLIYNIINDESPLRNDMVTMLYNELKDVIKNDKCPTIPLIVKGEA